MFLLTQVSVVCDSVNISGQGSTVHFPVLENRLSSDLEDLFISGALADIVISCGSRKFNCHRAILAARWIFKKFYFAEFKLPFRSTVFRAMFEHDMEEKKNSAVNVEDVESDAMASMLHFIYTGGRVDRGVYLKSCCNYY